MDPHDPNFDPNLVDAFDELESFPFAARDLFFATVLVAIVGVCVLLGLEMHDA